MLFSQIGRPGWDPFTEMRRLQADMNRLFEGVGVGAFPGPRAYPPVNLWLGDESVVVTAELPGLSTDDIHLAVREDTLTIEGERKAPAADERASWFRRERPFGSFSRSIELPFRVDPDRVKARVHDGVLEIELQRPQEDLPRRIAINGS